MCVKHLRFTSYSFFAATSTLEALSISEAWVECSHTDIKAAAQQGWKGTESTFSCLASLEYNSIIISSTKAIHLSLFKDDLWCRMSMLSFMFVWTFTDSWSITFDPFPVWPVSLWRSGIADVVCLRCSFRLSSRVAWCHTSLQFLLLLREQIFKPTLKVLMRFF